MKSLKSKVSLIDTKGKQPQKQQPSALSLTVPSRDVNRTEAANKVIPGPATSQTSLAEWKQWILRHLDEYVLRISGNEGINLIAGTECIVFNWC
jgi:hypothetical protein